MGQRTPEQEERLQETWDLQERLEEAIDPDGETDVLARYRYWFDHNVDKEAEREDGYPTDASLDDQYIEQFIEIAAEPSKWKASRHRDDVW